MQGTQETVRKRKADDNLKEEEEPLRKKLKITISQKNIKE
jgi:hypothetical protein